MFEPSDFAVALQNLSDAELASAYEQYMESASTRWFSEIFWEANRRGLSLVDLEEILNGDNNSFL